ncbi:MAG: hypothetical protein ACLFS9_08960 [Nitriliruptoraceae bacterium]
MDLIREQHARTVTAPEDRTLLLAPRHHRTEVVRRLLGAGISPATLCAIVPEWTDLITGLEQEHEAVRLPIANVG